MFVQKNMRGCGRERGGISRESLRGDDAHFGAEMRKSKVYRKENSGGKTWGNSLEGNKGNKVTKGNLWGKSLRYFRGERMNILREKLCNQKWHTGNNLGVNLRYSILAENGDFEIFEYFGGKTWVISRGEN